MPYEPLESKRMYQRAEALADRVWQIVTTWQWFPKRTVGCQWVEATDSVGANIAEAGGRYHPADVRNFLYHSRGSLRECKFWLRRSRVRNLVTEQESTEIDSEIEELSRNQRSHQLSSDSGVEQCSTRVPTKKKSK